MAIAVRSNSDLTKIMIHHTGSTAPGKVLNTQFVRQGQFGLPYDIVINQDGTCDLTSRWIYGVSGSQYVAAVNIHKILTYATHHISEAVQKTELNRNTLHIALVGDLTQREPRAAQLGKLVSLLNLLLSLLSLGTQNIVYHAEVDSTACPGRRFLTKAVLLSLLTVARSPRETVDYSLIVSPELFKPPFFSVSEITSTTISLLWGSVPSLWEVDHYTIYFKGTTLSGAFTDWVIVATPGPGVTTYTHTGLLPGYQYQYQLTATLTSGVESNPL